MTERRVPRAHALRAKLEAVGWVMVRFLRRHSLDKNSAQFHRQLSHDSSSSSSDTADMHEPHGNGRGGTPPLPNGRAAAAGAPRSRFGRDGPPSGTTPPQTLWFISFLMRHQSVREIDRFLC